MNITHDLIAAVNGPGWKYGLSRILIDDQNNGVVFIAGSEKPFASFTVSTVSTSRGTGTNSDGEITWRRRGSSCQYKLAKCKVSTATIQQWWTDSLNIPVTSNSAAVEMSETTVTIQELPLDGDSLDDPDDIL